MTGHVGIVFEPEEERSSSWLQNSCRTWEAPPVLPDLHPPGNGAACKSERINALDSRRDHQHFSHKSGMRSFRDEALISNLQEQ
jgi:hypothetical protein